MTPNGIHIITRAMLTDEAGNFRPDWYARAFSMPSGAEPTTDWTAAEYSAIVEAEIVRTSEAVRWAVEQDVWTTLYEASQLREAA